MSEIKNKEDFLNSLKELSKNTDNWENLKTKEFIEALISYSEDIDGYYKNTNQNTDSEKASWKLFSDIIHGATIYE
jgi:hypothetical protein